jgi:MinD-like ATPase involved in chromosome partitioning or flagellar assembly
MALANTACILAEQETNQNGKGVLMIDWDLEAPGLHRYFKGRLAASRLGIGSYNARESYDSSQGLIDLFYELDKGVDSLIKDQGEHADTCATEQAAREVIDRIDLSTFTLQTTIKGLSLLKAGRFDAKDPNEYSERVNKFNWELLFKKSPHLIRVLGETLAAKYSYVLIDSRTGITDISGITTMLLPEKLVVVFTPNLQSLTGGLELIRKATDYRKESVDLRPLTVYPLVSRVEANEPELRHDWRFGNQETEGYQLEFEKVLSTVYAEQVHLNHYFDELQIQHIPRYAYGEEIAVLVEKTEDRFSLRRSYQSFATKLIASQAPWQGEIDGSTAFDRRQRTISDIVEFVIDAISLNKVSREVRFMVVVLFLMAAAGIAYFQYQRSVAATQSVRAQLALSESKNQALQQQVAELQDPIKGILAENNKRINALVQQVSEVSAARDAATEQAQQAQDAAAQSKLQADRAQQAQKQVQISLKESQADVANAEASFKDAMTKYTTSQKEVKYLQSQLVKCRQ